VSVTSSEKDGLRYVIDELKPRLVFVESCFYQSATPFMMGRLLRDVPGLSVAVFSLGEFPDELAALFFFCGAKGYLNFRDGYCGVKRGLKKILRGEEFWMESVRRRVDERQEMPDLAYNITPRQMEVLRMVCNGFQTLEIGDALHIGKRTVEKHKQGLYDALHVRNEGELIRIAFLLDLIHKTELCFYGKK
jgi:DNA-binding NarL/FixJ family response regulator